MARKKHHARSAELNLFSMISDQNLVFFSLFLKSCYMPRTCHLPWPDHTKVFKQYEAPIHPGVASSLWIQMLSSSPSSETVYVLPFMSDTKYHTRALRIQRTHHVRILHDESAIRWLPSAFPFESGLRFDVVLRLRDVDAMSFKSLLEVGCQTYLWQVLCYRICYGNETANITRSSGMN
jgi:hypothetical protein